MEIAISGGAGGTQVTKGPAPGVVVLQQVWWGGLCGLKDPHPPPPPHPTPANCMGIITTYQGKRIIKKL